MQKRAGLARAIALDPDVLFFDEPSAGLDPVTSRLLDDLILSLRDSLGATVVIVSHELREHLRDRRRLRLPRHRDAHDQRARQPTPAARSAAEREHPSLSHPRAYRWRGRSHAVSRGRRANPVIIGAFVLGALALGAGGRRRVGIGAVVPPHRDVRLVLQRVGERPQPRSAGQVPRRPDRFRDPDPVPAGASRQDQAGRVPSPCVVRHRPARAFRARRAGRAGPRAASTS